ncbi:hypothetical protein CDAR_122841 [Caerostris darwini]|uniref:Uncharacterized protein n=1 Tax=Caerostris darwini TaxID=1538125 RepID=A0AAV4UYQ0_9ARAC|nr:hypothetical protein CDAR_122841 [Caerostris darwini]
MSTSSPAGVQPPLQNHVSGCPAQQDCLSLVETPSKAENTCKVGFGLENVLVCHYLAICSHLSCQVQGNLSYNTRMPNL